MECAKPPNSSFDLYLKDVHETVEPYAITTEEWSKAYEKAVKLYKPSSHEYLLEKYGK